MDYSQHTVIQLKAICKERNINGISKKNKNELIEMIKQNENENENLSVSESKNDAKTDIKIEPAVKVKVKTSKVKTISKEDAEKSANEWVGAGESLMRTWLVNAIMDSMQHRDIGKVLANVAEIYVNKWLSEKSGRSIKSVVGKSYDGETDDDKIYVRNQIKFRMDEWHFETTRRNSKKNEETNSTGHVAYKKDEFDMVAIFKPSPTFGITGSTIRCIPVEALINPKKQDQLITRINKNIRDVYDCDEKTEEVIRLLYQTPSSLQD